MADINQLYAQYSQPQFNASSLSSDQMAAQIAQIQAQQAAPAMQQPMQPAQVAPVQTTAAPQRNAAYMQHQQLLADRPLMKSWARQVHAEKKADPTAWRQQYGGFQNQAARREYVNNGWRNPPAPGALNQMAAAPVILPQAQIRAQPSYQQTAPAHFYRGGLAHFAEGGLVDEDGEEELLDQPDVTPSSPDFMRQMLAQYMQPNTQYAEEFSKARENASTQQAQFDELVKQAMERKTAGPSRAELFYNLAAAFGTPGKTGNFFEQAGGAAKVLADNQKQQRDADSSDKANALAIGLERAKLGVTSSKDDLNNLRTLAAGERKDKRDIVLAQLKADLAAGKPQSEAGKIALDSGLKPGTPEFGAFVNDYVQRKLQNGDLYKQAMLSIAQGGLKVREKQADLATTQAAKLNPQEIKLKDEAEAAMNAAKVAYGLLAKVYNKSDSAYAGSGVDVIKKGMLGAVGSEDPAYLDSQEVENLLGKAGVAGLKTTMGPQISDADVKFGTALEGLSTTSGAARKRVVKNSMDALKEAYLYRKKKFEEISSGKYRIAEPSAAGPGLDEEPLNMDDLGAP